MKLPALRSYIKLKNDKLINENQKNTFEVHDFKPPKLKRSFKRNPWNFISAIILIIVIIITVSYINEMGLSGALYFYHLISAILSTAFSLSLISGNPELGWNKHIGSNKIELLISSIISISLIIIGGFYWTKNYWIGLLGFTLVFYLLFYGFNFIIGLFKKDR